MKISKTVLTKETNRRLLFLKNEYLEERDQLTIVRFFPIDAIRFHEVSFFLRSSFTKKKLLLVPVIRSLCKKMDSHSVKMILFDESRSALNSTVVRTVSG